MGRLVFSAAGSGPDTSHRIIDHRNCGGLMTPSGRVTPPSADDHFRAQRHREDLRRQNALIRAGFVVLRYTGLGCLQPASIVAEVRAALRM